MGGDETGILTWDTLGIACVWDARSGDRRAALEGFYHVALNRDGTRALTWGVKDEAKLSEGERRSMKWQATLWDLSAARELARLDHLHVPIDSAVFSPDGGLVLTNAVSQIGVWVRVWKADDIDSSSNRIG